MDKCVDDPLAPEYNNNHPAKTRDSPALYWSRNNCADFAYWESTTWS